MYLTPFVLLFPGQAEAETRVFTPLGHSDLPTDEYALVESYCTDPACDCRRVMLNVAGRQQGKRFLASISFGFDRDDEMAGPFLDPLNPQSEHAEALLAVVKQVLEDPAYVARLESHYRQVKEAAADPSHPIQKVLRRLEEEPQGSDTTARERLIAARRAALRAKRKKRGR